MRFPGYGGSGSKSVRLIGPLGKEHKVELAIAGEELHLCAKGQGQVLEALPLCDLTWAPCALPGRDRQHCLSLQLAAAPPRRPRELLLVAPSRDAALNLAALLDTASQRLAQRSLQQELQRRSQLQASEGRGDVDGYGGEGVEMEGQREGGDPEEEGWGEEWAQEGMTGGEYEAREEGNGDYREEGDGVEGQGQEGSPGGQSLSLRGSEAGSRGPSEDLEGTEAGTEVASGCGCSRYLESQAGQDDAEDSSGGLPAAAAAALLPSPSPAARPHGPQHSFRGGTGASATVRLLAFSSKAGTELEVGRGDQSGQQREAAQPVPALPSVSTARQCEVAAHPRHSSSGKGQQGGPGQPASARPPAGPAPQWEAAQPAPARPSSGRAPSPSGTVSSHVRALEEMVCQLSQEVANSRGNTPRAKSARRGLLSDFLDSPAASPTRQQAAVSEGTKCSSPRSPGAPGPSPPMPPPPGQPPSQQGKARPTSPGGSRPQEAARGSGGRSSPGCGMLGGRGPPPHAAAASSDPGGTNTGANRDSGGANPSSSSRDSGGVNSSGGSSQQVATLLEENSALFRRVSELQSELGAAEAQLELAAADNVRLAREAAGAVHELQGAAGAAAAGRERERQLQSSLAEAIQRCEVVGRELALFSGQMDRRAAQCEELRREVEALGHEKTVLTAALTTAQLQLREATPAGFAAQAAELQRQSTAAAMEAATAREAAAAAERDAAAAGVRLAESQRREAEAASHVQEAARLVEEARAARRAGLARELQLAAELAALRAQLGRQEPAEGALQRQVGELSRERAELSSQLAELQRVGEALSRSCASLEASLGQAVRERDALREALSKVQQAQQGAEAAWDAERAALERQLATLTAALQGEEGSASSSKSQVQVLQAQLEAARQELSEARQRATSREAELQSELRLLASKSESEARGLRERLEAAAGAQSAAVAAGAEREAALGAARREVEAAQGEVRRLKDEMRRLRDEHAVSSRGLQLEVSSLRTDNARIGQQAAQAQGATAALKGSLEAAQREAQQARAQLAAAASAQVELSQECKELQRKLDRAGVERDRAARERDALGLRYASLQQQYRLLEVVLAQGQQGTGGNGGQLQRLGLGALGGSLKESGALEQQAFFGGKARARQSALVASSPLSSASYSD